MSALEDADANVVTVVGASDGKFVLPLARAGYRVNAIECDDLALSGGPVELPTGPGHMAGLIQRLAAEDLSDRVSVFRGDFLRSSWREARADAVWTSCSWHYSMNHHAPLGAYLERLSSCVVAGGHLGCEYMMPVEPRHFASEHYPQEGVVPARLLEFTTLWEAYTPPFVEAPHVEQLQAHVHRMGFYLGQKDGER